MNALHTLFANGTIRNAEGNLIGFYDAEANLVHINGHVAAFRAIDAEHAMDLIAQHA